MNSSIRKPCLHTRPFDAMTPGSYHSIGDFYKKNFGTKPKKIPVSIADDCPNRRGLKNMETCIFCDVWGSAAFPEQRNLDLKNQIQEKIEYFNKKYKSSTFLIYFQAYTSTFLGVKGLRQSFEIALGFPQVKGIVIGTRPDCVSAAVLDLWREYSRKCFFSVELGVQSFFDSKLEFLRRGHSAETSIAIIKKIKQETDVDLGIHLIFGLPEETDQEIIETAKMISKLDLDNVKLHNLHVLKNTPLQKLYEAGQFTPMSLEEYAPKVGLFLQYLSPKISVHRLAALSSRWDELVAPSWTRHKMETYQFIINHMKAKGIYQGQLYGLQERVPSMHSL